MDLFPILARKPPHGGSEHGISWLTLFVVVVIRHLYFVWCLMNLLK
jgi:hypothetical protein